MGFAFFTLVTFSIYFPVTTSGLLADDWILSYPWESPWKSFCGHWIGGGHGSFYRPLSRIVVFYEARLFGYDGTGQHYVSLCLFVLTAFLVSFKVASFAGPFPGLVCAAMILFPRVQVQAVSWIACQTDLLAGLFICATVCAVVRPLEGLLWRHVTAGALFAVLAYLSKDSAVILGPLAFLYLLGYTLSYGRRAVLVSRTCMAVLVSQLVLWGLYLVARRVLLGQVLVPDPGHFRPERGEVWHLGLVLATGVRQMIDLVYPFLFPARAEIPPFSAVWVGLLLLCLVCWLVARRHYVAGMVLAGWLVALIPLVTMRAPYFYPDRPGGDHFRFLYVPSLFLAASLGLSLRTRHDRRPRGGEAGFVALVVISIIMCNGTLTDALAYRKAAASRERIKTSLSPLVSRHPDGFALAALKLPERCDKAFVFINGFYEFLKAYYPSAILIDAKNPDLGIVQLKPVYKLYCADSESVLLEPFREVQRLAEALRSPLPTPPPHVIDGSRSIVAFRNIAPSPDIRLLERGEGYFDCEITGYDPQLTIDVPKTKPTYSYRKAVLEFELLDAPAGTARTATKNLYHVVWAHQASNYQSVDAEVPVIAGKQKIEFPLMKQPMWYADGNLLVLRFDLGSAYKGRIRITCIGLE